MYRIQRDLGFTPAGCADMLAPVYHMHLDAVETGLGLLLDPPAPIDPCSGMDRDTWLDLACNTLRLTTRSQLDEWLAG